MARKAYRRAATVQIAARFVGNLQWICPECLNMQSGPKQKVNWRSPTAECRQCDTIFDLGLAFGPAEDGSDPLAGHYSTVPAGWTVNVVGQLPPGRPLTGRLVGAIWWICGCKRIRRCEIDWQRGDIACRVCGDSHRVALLLWKAQTGRGRKGRTPLDWILPVWDTEDAKELHRATHPGPKRH